MKRAFTLALAALLLTGCTAAPAASGSTASAEPTPAAESAETPETPAENAGSAQPLRPLLEGAEKQYYMVEMVTGELIRYCVADLTAHETAVPCTVEGCAHDTEDCPAVFRRGECDKVFVLDEDTLVAFTNNNFPETEDSQVVLLDRDCQNRRVVATLPDGYCMALASSEADLPYTDGTYLYCYGFHYGDGGGAALFRIDPASGEVSDLLEGADLESPAFCGALGRKFVFSVADFTYPEPTGDVVTDALADASGAITYWVLDADSGALETLRSYSTADGSYDRMYGTVLGGRFYEVDREAGTLAALDPDTGEMQTITDALPGGKQLAQYGLLQAKVQDWLVLSDSTLLVNVQTGEVRAKPALPDNYWNGSAHQPYLYLNLGDTLLVDCRYEPYVRTVIGSDGAPYTVDATHKYLGLISAEDYLNGVPNYTEVGEYIA